MALLFVSIVNHDLDLSIGQTCVLFAKLVYKLSKQTLKVFSSESATSSSGYIVNLTVHFQFL